MKLKKEKFIHQIVYQNINIFQKAKEFMDEYNDLTKKIKDDYIKNFWCPQDDEEYEEALINY